MFPLVCWGNRPEEWAKRQVTVYGFAKMFGRVCRGRMYAARKPNGRGKVPGKMRQPCHGPQTPHGADPDRAAYMRPLQCGVKGQQTRTMGKKDK